MSNIFLVTIDRAGKYCRGSAGTGACVPCPHGYVNKTSEPGAKTFANGEFHCAPALVELVV